MSSSSSGLNNASSSSTDRTNVINDTNTRDQNQRNVQARTILSPMDETQVSRLVFNRCRNEVKLNDLANDDKIFELNLNRIYINVELLRIITPAADIKANVYH